MVGCRCFRPGNIYGFSEIYQSRITITGTAGNDEKQKDYPGKPHVTPEAKPESLMKGGECHPRTAVRRLICQYY